MNDASSLNRLALGVPEALEHPERLELLLRRQAMEKVRQALGLKVEEYGYLGILDVIDKALLESENGPVDPTKLSKEQREAMAALLGMSRREALHRKPQLYHRGYVQAVEDQRDRWRERAFSEQAKRERMEAVFTETVEQLRRVASCLPCLATSKHMVALLDGAQQRMQETVPYQAPEVHQ